MTLTYLDFHLLFVFPPIFLLAVTLWRVEGPDRPFASFALALMPLLALLYTAPWDNFLIRQGVWWYGEGTVLLRIEAAPLGEYLFFVLQPVLTGLWLYHVGFSPAFEPGDLDRRVRALGAGVWLALAAVGYLLLGRPGGYYLGAILVWAGPIIALQWGVGAAYLLRTWRRWTVAVAVPTLYLWMADRVAIGLGIWTISKTHTTGLTLLGLPVEEAAFFLVTNLLVVQGMVLFEWVLGWWR